MNSKIISKKDEQCFAQTALQNALMCFDKMAVYIVSQLYYNRTHEKKSYISGTWDSVRTNPVLPRT